MSEQHPSPARLRHERKQDLLLASQALRLQTLVTLNDLGGRADVLAGRLARVRAALAHPAGLAGVALLGLWLVRRALRPVRRGMPPRRARPWLRWAWLAWRAWQAAPPLLRAFARR